VAKLAVLSAEDKRNQSQLVLKKLFDLPAFQNSQRISTFLSIDNEIDTEPIVRKVLEEKKECFVPRYGKKGMEMVKLNSIEDWKTLPLTSWGIKQPSFKDARENALKTGGLDFIVVPGVAFTSSGLRCGHGGGYYDRFLKEIKESQDHPPAIVGVAFKQQILEDLPTTEHDVKLDLVLYSD